MLQGRILIVDDDPEWIEILNGLLTPFEEQGVLVDSASSYTEAKRKLDRQRFDLVTMDIQLDKGIEKEEVSTEELLKWELLLQKCRSKQINVIVVSSYRTDERTRRAFKDYKVHDFLAKEVLERKEFIESVEEVLQEVAAVRSGGGGEGMRAKPEELNDKKAEVQAINETLNDITQLYEDGELDRDHYSRKLRKWRKDRNKLISEIQIILEDTEAAELGNLLERAKGEELEEDEIKTEVKQIADEKGWGDKVLEQIDKHKGEIVSLIVAIAIELGKRATT